MSLIWTAIIQWSNEPLMSMSFLDYKCTAGVVLSGRARISCGWVCNLGRIFVKPTKMHPISPKQLKKITLKLLNYLHLSLDCDCIHKINKVLFRASDDELCLVDTCRIGKDWIFYASKEELQGFALELFS